MTAPPTVKISDTFAPWIALTRLFAFFQVCEFAWGARQVNLARACVACSFCAHLHPFRTCRRVWCTSRTWSWCQPHGNRLIRRFGLRALGAEMAAPLGAPEERDAPALCIILTRLLACLDVGNIVRRLTLVDLTSARVTLHIWTDLRPRVFCRCGSLNRLQEVSSVNKVYSIGC